MEHPWSIETDEDPAPDVDVKNMPNEDVKKLPDKDFDELKSKDDKNARINALINELNHYHDLIDFSDHAISFEKN